PPCMPGVLGVRHGARAVHRPALRRMPTDASTASTWVGVKVSSFVVDLVSSSPPVDRARSAPSATSRGINTVRPTRTTSPAHLGTSTSRNLRGLSPIRDAILGATSGHPIRVSLGDSEYPNVF